MIKIKTEINLLSEMYKRLLYLICLLTAAFFSCNDPSGFKKPEDALDCGREFIRAVLDGDYNKAELYLLNDEEDIRLFKRYEEYMRKQSDKEKLGLRSSSIIINNVETLNDSISVINYSNSFTKQPEDIRVIKRNSEWWVDFSYTFSGEEPEQPQQ